MIALLLTTLALAQTPAVFDEPAAVEHGSTLLARADGGMLLCWYAGSAEAHRDVKIYCRERPAGGEWSRARVAIEPGYRPANGVLPVGKVANAALVQNSQGIVTLFWAAIPLTGGFSNTRIDYASSADGGRTWSHPRRLDDDFGAMVRSKPLSLGNDEFLLPAYDELALDKYGYTWRLRLRDGRAQKLRHDRIPLKGHIQPALVRCGDTICAYMRNKDRGLTWVSKWEGERWGAGLETNLPNSNSPVDGVKLADGRVLLIYNASAVRPRAPLSLAVSRDGVCFEKVEDLEADLAKDHHYPAMVMDAQGAVHVSYTHPNRDSIKYVPLAGRSWPRQGCSR
jgi:hypothetical protein